MLCYFFCLCFVYASKDWVLSAKCHGTLRTNQLKRMSIAMQACMFLAIFKATFKITVFLFIRITVGYSFLFKLICILCGKDVSLCLFVFSYCFFICYFFDRMLYAFVQKQKRSNSGSDINVTYLIGGRCSVDGDMVRFSFHIFL